MVQILHTNKVIAQDLLKLIEDAGQTTSSLRPYLGMSELGHSCNRSLWYSFRWCYEQEISGRINRLFNRGHREEPALIQILESVGLKYSSNQMSLEMAYGYCKGHIDGIVTGVPGAPIAKHLVEFKTMNEQSFKQVIKNGVEQSKPIYFAQMQSYMQQAGLNRGLFITVNKNTDELYIERVKLDANKAYSLELKAIDIIEAPGPPLQISTNSTAFVCRFCNAKNICHKLKETPINTTCRTCEQIVLLKGGVWACKLQGVGLSNRDQKQACDAYFKLTTLS